MKNKLQIIISSLMHCLIFDKQQKQTKNYKKQFKKTHCPKLLIIMYSAFTSKNRQLAQKLSKKLQPSNSNIEFKQEINQHKGLDQKYRETLEKLKIFKTKGQRNQIQIGHDLERVQDAVFTLERIKNKYVQTQGQGYEGFQKFVQGQLTQNSQKMAAVRKGMIQDIDKKKKTMKTDAIEIIEAEFQQMCKANLFTIDKKMSQVSLILQEQRQAKDESAAYLAQTVGEEILKLEQMIAQQRQQRKNHNSKLLQLIAQVEQKIDKQIQQQVKSREKAQEHIQSLLEEVCYKIQAKILGNS